MKTYLTSVSIIVLIGMLVAGCATAPKANAGRNQLTAEAVDALEQAQQSDPSLAKFLNNSSGYAVFPHVSKGGAIVGGSYGRGTVYAAGEQIGYADITQATVGLQAGGQQFREIVVFESQGDLNRFKAGKLSLAGNLSAVALKTGTAESARYTDGVAVFVQPIGGLMVEAAVGGQQFTYQRE